VKRRHLWLIGIATFWVVIIANIPARLIASALPAKASLVIEGLSGSIWKGHATRLRWGTQTLGSLRWELSPWSLLTLNIAGDFKLEKGTSHLSGYLSFGRKSITFEQLRATLSAEDINPWTGNWVQIRGLVMANIPHAKLVKNRILAIDGVIAWQHAQLKTPFVNWIKLGDMQANMVPEKNSTQISISDGGEPLGVKANVLLSLPVRVDLKGSANAKQAVAIQNFLRMIAKPGPQGRWYFQYQGRIPGF